MHLVFPTRVGVDLTTRPNMQAAYSFPHTRGGGPILEATDYPGGKFSPHAWGWTEKIEAMGAAIAVFPTRVGVDRPSWLAA